MRKTLVLLFALFLSAVVTASTDLPKGAVSPARIELLTKLFHEAVQAQGDNVTAESLTAYVMPKFLGSDGALRNRARFMVITPEESALEATKKLNAAADKAFPEYTNAQLKKLAAQRYPLYEVRDDITVIYKISPKLTRSTTGRITALRNGMVELNGKHRIRFKDMEGLEVNEGPDGQLAKLNKNYNTELRDEYINELIKTSTAGHKKFLEEKAAEFAKNQQIADFLLNEQHGFTFWNSEWLRPAEIIQRFADTEAEKCQRRLEEHNARVLDNRNNVVEEQLRMTDAANAITPVGSFPSAEKVLAAREAEKKRQQERLEQQRLEEQLKAEREEKEAQRRARRAEQRKREAERKAREAREAQAREAAEGDGMGMMTVVVGGLILIIVGGGLGWWFYSRREKDLDVASFFEGRGKIQKDFWDAANADPENFKYVAYLFEDLPSAKQALSSLSFITITPDGVMMAKRQDIEFGTYPHQGRAVAFIGGVSLNYARWREASMVWPELPGASYFKVSAEPAVKLELPNMDDFMHDSGIHVDDLGSVDEKSESGEIIRVFLYRCDSKNNALLFLSKFNVEEEGIMVRVDTPEGQVGKDFNGIFTA